MTSRDRILAAVRHEPLDRIPLDMWATGETRQKLMEHFGTWDEIRGQLHLDHFTGVGADYNGPKLTDMPPGSSIDFWGIQHTSMAYDGGEYAEVSVSPLAGAQSIADIDAYPWPSADWFDYSQMRAAAESLHETSVVQCGYMAPFYFHNQLRGLEQSLMDPLLDPELAHHIIDRISDFFYAYHRRMFEACAGLIDIAQVTDDLGSQAGPLISLETYREFYKPQHKRFCELCHEFGIYVFHHDDGSIRQFIPDLIEIGIDILNPIQWVCPGMALGPMKQDFGDAICFHGGIENQKILPFGTPEDVRAEVRHCIDNLASDQTGYILASSHNIQSNTPVENIIAMYDEAYHYGRF